MRLFLRLFADCKDAEIASTISQLLCSALSPLAAKVFSSPKQYWKIPTQFEFTFTFTPPTEDAFQKLISLASLGWHLSDTDSEPCAVWNRTNGSVFLIPEVSWANIELHATAS